MNSSNDAAWLKKYDELIQFKFQEGHCNVPHVFVENKSLGNWVHHQRKQYWYMKQGKPSNITQSRIRYLDNIGFQWSIKDPKDDAWFKRFEELKEFKCREGHFNVPRGSGENKSLGTWVNHQRMQYKYMQQGKPCKITAQRIQHLTDIGFQWNTNGPNDDAWLKRYEELKEFMCREGHCNIPRGFGESKSLGNWVNDQRKLYRYMIQCKPSKVTKRRIELLKDIGFQWIANRPDNAWYKKYEELKEFKRREGHCNVPCAFDENKSLGNWVHHQRKLYRYKKQGKPSRINDQRIQHLQNIGFKWNANGPKNDAWYKKYEELKEFKCREGHCNVPHLFSENRSLGVWVNRQRTQYKYKIEGKPSNITEKRIQALEDIDFSWTAVNSKKSTNEYHS